MLKAKKTPLVTHCSPRALLPTLAVSKYRFWFLWQMICDAPSMLYYEADK